VIYKFDGCELDLRRFELRRNGRPCRIEPQVFDVLVLLMRERDRVVTKEEILDTVWGDRSVSESALTSRIKALHQALGDDGKAQRLVRTVRGRGYRLIRYDERGCGLTDWDVPDFSLEARHWPRAAIATTATRRSCTACAPC
jgi:DNA-binding winged helix-turn-helix (wHTH) protein